MFSLRVHEAHGRFSGRYKTVFRQTVPAPGAQLQIVSPVWGISVINIAFKIFSHHRNVLTSTLQSGYDHRSCNKKQDHKKHTLVKIVFLEQTVQSVKYSQQNRRHVNHNETWLIPPGLQHKESA